MVPSPVLNQCSLSDRLIALGAAAETQYVSLTSYKPPVCLDLGRVIHIAFIRDRANYVPDFGLRIWDIAGLMDEHWHFRLWLRTQTARHDR